MFSVYNMIYVFSCHQLMLFLHRLTHTHVGLTAWRIFNINRQTILTASRSWSHSCMKGGTVYWYSVLQVDAGPIHVWRVALFTDTASYKWTLIPFMYERWHSLLIQRPTSRRWSHSCMKGGTLYWYSVLQVDADPIHVWRVALFTDTASYKWTLIPFMYEGWHCLLIQRPTSRRWSHSCMKGGTVYWYAFLQIDMKMAVFIW